MALPLPELRAKEIPHRLSQLSLAAFSRAGFNDPDPAVTPIVLQGHLASTDISVSILIDTGASLDGAGYDEMSRRCEAGAEQGRREACPNAGEKGLL